MNGEKTENLMSYLNDIEQLSTIKCQAKTVEEFLEIDNLLLALKVRSAYQLKTLIKKMDESKASKSEKTNDLFADFFLLSGKQRGRGEDR